ncbi:MAG: type II CAAX endopeptidase family protein [candidate division WOR-3 bacterium]
MAYIFFSFLIFYNNLINLLPAEFHAKIYVVVNLAILIILFFIAKKFLNLNLNELGYETKYIGSGIATGLIATLVIIGIFILLLLLLPKTGIKIKPPVIELGSLTELLYRVLIRIPAGTAFFEENLFRGICYGYLIKRFTPKKTIFFTSLLFGIWHIVPALKVVTANFQMGLNLYGILFWCAGILGAFFAGVFFALMRYYSKNIVGCILSHSLINDLSLFIIYYLWK